MSQRDELKDMLFEQLADLEIFERLLRFDPARQKLFLCLATLISRGKPLASQIKQTYTGRYKQEPAVVAQTSSTSVTTKTASKLAKLAKAKLALSCKSHNNEQSTSSTATSSSTSHSTIAPSIDETIIQAADASDSNDEASGNYHFGLDAIDFGLRLGSFLSEAGWFAESIDILKCVATKLKRMTLDKNLKIIYLDCLQRLDNFASEIINLYFM